VLVNAEVEPDEGAGMIPRARWAQDAPMRLAPPRKVISTCVAVLITGSSSHRRLRSDSRAPAGAVARDPILAKTDIKPNRMRSRNRNSPGQ